MDAECRDVGENADSYVANMLPLTELLWLAAHISKCVTCMELIEIKRMEKEDDRARAKKLPRD